MDKVNEFKQAFFLLPYTVKNFPNLTSRKKNTLCSLTMCSIITDPEHILLKYRSKAYLTKLTIKFRFSKKTKQKISLLLTLVKSKSKFVAFSANLNFKYD